MQQHEAGFIQACSVFQLVAQYFGIWVENLNQRTLKFKQGENAVI